MIPDHSGLLPTNGARPNTYMAEPTLAARGQTADLARAISPQDAASGKFTINAAVSGP